MNLSARHSRLQVTVGGSDFAALGLSGREELNWAWAAKRTAPTPTPPSSFPAKPLGAPNSQRCPNCPRSLV